MQSGVNYVKDPKGEDLSTFLQNKEHLITNKRILYVVQPLMAQGKWVKFGTAGIRADKVRKDSAKNRLKSYIRIYGEIDIDDKCSGVKIFYCSGVRFTRNSSGRTSRPYHIERKLINKYKAEGKRISERGDEIVTVRPKQIIQDIAAFNRIPTSQLPHTPSFELGKRKRLTLRSNKPPTLRRMELSPGD